jgi:protease-4
MRTFGKVLLALLASMGFLTLLAIVGVFYGISRLEHRTPSMPVTGKMVLSLDLDEQYVEGSSGPKLEGFNLTSSTSLQDLVIAIRRAKDDERVVALKATVSGTPLGFSQIQDVRDAVAEFKASGKKAYLFSETLGEGGGALPTYYLATAFNDIWLQPSGNVGIAGIGMESFFLKNFLARFGLKGSFLARGEYKSAPEMFVNTGMSPANREESTALIQGWYNQMAEGIAEARSLDANAVKALIDKGSQVASDALEQKLVDHLGYRDQFEDMLKTASSNATEVELDKYIGMPRATSLAGNSKRIAVIHAVGEISRGEDSPSLVGGSTGIYSDSMVKALRKAADDKKIEAIVIRVNSPGGSAVASDTIWREVVKAKEKGKPIIVSMGDAAASGGYYIAMAADRIFAQPATITGSIGVFTGKPVIGEALKKLDINYERITAGESAGTYSVITDFSPTDLEAINRALDETYREFTTKAAQGRGKSVEDIIKVARGRVWTGEDAVKAGLVDELGGFTKAVDYAKTKIGLKATDQVVLVNFPEPDQPLWALFNAFNSGEMPISMSRDLKTLMWLERVLAPVLREIDGRGQGVQAYMTPVIAN